MSSLALPVAALDACGFIRRSLIIWDKGHIVIGRGHYHWRHETCWYAVKKGAKANWAGDRKASTLWEIDNLSLRRSRYDSVGSIARPEGTDSEVFFREGILKAWGYFLRPLDHGSKAYGRRLCRALDEIAFKGSVAACHFSDAPQDVVCELARLVTPALQEEGLDALV